MVNVELTCRSGCGDVAIPLAAMKVIECSDTHEAAMLFRCPSCQVAGNTGITDAALARFVALGVPVNRWDPPAELGDRDRYGNEPFTSSDADIGAACAAVFTLADLGWPTP